MPALRWSLAATTLIGLTCAAAPVGATPEEEGRLVAGLSGAKEVPGPGDRDGSGRAALSVDAESGEICYELTVRNIAPATAAHIHVGARDGSGPVAQGLQAPTNGTSSGCVVNPTVAAALLSNPHGYYVNVHNSEFPGGAVRGQLAGRT